MAKKKKKQSIKINNKIRELMSGEPFDEGIKKLDENILVELTMLLDLKVPMLTKKEMTRALRQTWAEADSTLRLGIVNLLEQLGVKTPSKRQVEDKVDHIVTILGEYEYTREEEQEILSAFIDSKLSKITDEKVANKLNYIRQNKIMRKWEAVLDVKFNTSSKMEFYHSYEFDIDDKTFRKTLLTFSDYIDN
ncbi:helicase, partial [Sulfurovum sp. bin170]|nr:helicase [Sulfurovum sp. bin170]